MAGSVSIIGSEGDYEALDDCDESFVDRAADITSLVKEVKNYLDGEYGGHGTIHLPDGDTIQHGEQ